MRSPLIFHNVQSVDEELCDSSRVRRVSLKNVKRNFYQLTDGMLCVQFMRSDLASIKVIQCHVEDQAVIDFEVPRSSVFFEIVISRDWRVFNKDMAMNDFYEPTCSVVAYRKGNYQYHVRRGTHLLVLMALSKSWLEKKVDAYPNILEVLHAQSANEFYRLHKCPYKNQIKRIVTAFLYEEDHTSLDKAIASVLERTMRRYQLMIADGIQLSYDVDRSKVEELRLFIRQNYMNPICLSNLRLAEQFFVSERTLRRLAFKAFGHGIKQEVINCKMSYALKYLALMNKSVTEVAELTGYSDVHYFSRAFKTYWKIKPTDVYKP